MGFKKSDIEFHSDHFGPAHPAINIKVYGDLERVPLPLDEGRVSDDDQGKTWRDITTDPEFTHEWVEEHLTEESVNGWWEIACQGNYEWAKDEAKSIFKAYKVDVYMEGRSGGWFVVEGLPDVESWDAIMVSRWARLVKVCELGVDDVPRATLDLIYHNVFLPWQEERDATAADEAASRLPIEASI